MEPANNQPRPALAPMTLSDILDRSFELLRTLWRPILTVVMVAAVPLALVNFGLNLILGASLNFGFSESQVQSPEEIWAVLGALTGAGVLLAVLSLAVMPLVAGAINIICMSYLLGKEPVSAGSALRQMLPLWPAAIGATVLMLIGTTLGLLLCILPFFVVATFVALVYPVVAIEKVGPIAAIQRSIALVKGRFWQYLGTWVLAYFVVSIVANVAVLGPSVLSVFTFNIFVLSAAIDGVAVLLAYGITIPVMCALQVLIYTDARVRFEGMDLQVAAQGGVNAQPEASRTEADSRLDSDDDIPPPGPNF